MDKDPVMEITAARNRIVTAVNDNGCAVITAPPGTGKSTQVPLFFKDAPGTVVVLQPRRIAARGLAAYVSRQLSEEVGGTVGYRVRFDSRAGKNTKIVFQTYGVFVRQLISDPYGGDIGTVILDEYHERTLDTDLVLAWLQWLRRERPDKAPKFIVMSATLQAEELVAYLDDAPLIIVPAKAYPVDVMHLPPETGERLPDHAVRALRQVLARGATGAVLVFMPGAGEIRKTVQLAGAVCREYGIHLTELHGSLPLKAQSAVLDRARTEPCVIVSTNVTETSLTIPGITAVIDGGKERRGAYDHAQDRNTLHLYTISMSSAVQRAGRAGRTAPGTCVRLWTGEQERFMEEAVAPETTRLELSQLYLTAAGLLRTAGISPVDGRLLAWPDIPPQERWDHARQVLTDIGALDGEAGITAAGVKMLRLPVRPLAAALLLAGQECGYGLLAAAVIALWETDARAKDAGAVNLFTYAVHLVAGDDTGRETAAAFRQLNGFLDNGEVKKERGELTALSSKDERQRVLKKLADAWLPLLQRYIAVQEGTGGRYVFTGGKPAAIPERSGAPTHRPPALLGLSTLETGGGSRARQGTIVRYLPLEPRWIIDAYAGTVVTETVCRWDEKRKSAVAEVTVLLDGVMLQRREVPAAEADPEEAARLLAEYLTGNVGDALSDDAQELVARIRCVAGAFPEREYPLFGGDDWQLLFQDLAFGKSSIKEVTDKALLKAVREYAGPMCMAELDRLAPVSIKLPAGRNGKISYPEGAPPELRARIRDFIGWTGPFTVCAGRVAGIFDILAPSWRTTQKTADLDGFWTGSYLEIKKELKRRYPKHPWP